MTRRARLTRRPPEDVPDYVASAWDVLDRATGVYLGWVEAHEVVDYRRRGSRHGTRGTAYVSGVGWLARRRDGSLAGGSDLTDRAGAVARLLADPEDTP